MPSKPKLCFIVVNYENCDYTVLLLESLIYQVGRGSTYDSELLVVDNSVSEEQKKRIDDAMTKHETARVFRPQVNLGYFGGLNFGLEHIDSSRYDYVIVGNNDLAFSPDFSAELTKKKYQDEILVVAPNIITRDGRHQNPHVVGRVSRARLLIYDIYFYNYFLFQALSIGSSFVKKLIIGGRKKVVDCPQFIHMGIGACYILTPSFFKHFEKLDDSLFLYGEEAVLAGQVMSVNGRTFYDPSLVVTHAESATLSKFSTKFTYDHIKKSYAVYRKYL